MEEPNLIRIGEKFILIENIISEGGYGFIYKASEIEEKDFNRLKIRSVSPIKGKQKKQSKSKKLYSKFLKTFSKDKKLSKKSLSKTLDPKNLSRGATYALKKMITQNNERYAPSV